MGLYLLILAVVLMHVLISQIILFATQPNLPCTLLYWGTNSIYIKKNKAKHKIHKQLTSHSLANEVQVTEIICRGINFFDRYLVAAWFPRWWKFWFWRGKKGKNHQWLFLMSLFPPRAFLWLNVCTGFSFEEFWFRWSPIQYPRHDNENNYNPQYSSN